MKKILLLDGDGIGSEIVAEGQKILDQFSDILTYDHADIGGLAIDKHGQAYPDETSQKARNADAVILGAVGGPKWDHLPLAERPEKGLLALRKDLNVYANIRPVDLWDALSHFSPLKAERIKNVSFVAVRELTGGLYFGEPRGVKTDDNGKRIAWNTMVYGEDEITRIAHMAFKMAGQRRGIVHSIDKANVLEAMVLWREVVTEIHKEHYPEITLHHMYVDNAAMQMISRPNVFDVILTPNMFGDILSDESAVLPGSLGMLPSASLGDKHGLYEPIHGSAPDIAGQGIANPLGLILSVAMMFDSSLEMPEIGNKIRKAVSDVLDSGLRTADIHSDGMTKCSTSEMGDAVAKHID